MAHGLGALQMINPATLKFCWSTPHDMRAIGCMPDYLSSSVDLCKPGQEQELSVCRGMCEAKRYSKDLVSPSCLLQDNVGQTRWLKLLNLECCSDERWSTCGNLSVLNIQLATSGGCSYIYTFCMIFVESRGSTRAWRLYLSTFCGNVLFTVEYLVFDVFCSPHMSLGNAC